jgi:hypothetical protein
VIWYTSCACAVMMAVTDGCDVGTGWHLLGLCIALGVQCKSIPVYIFLTLLMVQCASIAIASCPHYKGGVTYKQTWYSIGEDCAEKYPSQYRIMLLLSTSWNMDYSATKHIIFSQ